jgi:hypothetical protein
MVCECGCEMEDLGCISFEGQLWRVFFCPCCFNEVWVECLKES